MRIVMMGTGTFAEPTFEALLASFGEDVVGLVTQPERDAGNKRGSTRQTGKGMANIAAARGVADRATREHQYARRARTTPRDAARSARRRGLRADSLEGRARDSRLAARSTFMRRCCRSIAARPRWPMPS